jgi:hypothetical protein
LHSWFAGIREFRGNIAELFQKKVVAACTVNVRYAAKVSGILEGLVVSPLKRLGGGRAPKGGMMGFEVKG